MSLVTKGYLDENRGEIELMPQNWQVFFLCHDALKNRFQHQQLSFFFHWASITHKKWKRNIANNKKVIWSTQSHYFVAYVSCVLELVFKWPFPMFSVFITLNLMRTIFVFTWYFPKIARFASIERLWCMQWIV